MILSIGSNEAASISIPKISNQLLKISLALFRRCGVFGI